MGNIENKEVIINYEHSDQIKEIYTTKKGITRRITFHKNGKIKEEEEHMYEKGFRSKIQYDKNGKFKSERCWKNNALKLSIWSYNGTIYSVTPKTYNVILHI